MPTPAARRPRPPAVAGSPESTAPSVERGRPALTIDEIFPPHDFGAWPEGFAMGREQLYGDEGR